MKDLFKSSRFKLIIVIIALLLVGMTLCAANGHGETAQSGITVSYTHLDVYKRQVFGCYAE